MFFPWPLFAIKITLSVFHFLLAGSMGAVLSIYSRFGGEYANSIRWIRQGGYLEMIISYSKSFKFLNSWINITTMSVFIACLAVDLVDDGASLFIKPAMRETNKSIYSTNMTVGSYFDAISTDDQPIVMVTMIQGDDVHDIIMSSLNNSNIIPGSIKGKVYRARTLAYEPLCTTVNIDSIFNIPQRSEEVVTKDPCTRLELNIYGGFKNREGAIESRSENGKLVVVPITFPANSTLDELSLIGYLKFNGSSCSASQIGRNKLTNGMEGLTSRPETTANKCVLSSGHIMAISVSVTRMIYEASYFRRLALSQLGATDSLFDNLKVLIDNGTFKNATFVAEARVNGTSVDVLACHSIPDNTSYLPLHCIYINANTILTKPQALYPSSMAFTKEVEASKHSSRSNLIRITQFPSWTIEGPSYNITDLRDVSSRAGDTVAKLGQNFLVDQYNYIEYDVADPQQGFEVPTWLVVAMVMAMVACATFWGLTLYFLDERFTSSLYKLVALEIGSHGDCATPLLKRSKVNPVEIDGVPIVAIGERHELRDKSLLSPLQSLESANSTSTNLEPLLRHT